MALGVLLYGPPASGKDTVTLHLAGQLPGCRLFPRIKVGSGRSDGYRMQSREAVEHLASIGAIIYQNDRYGATYVIDEPELRRMVGRGTIPVVHLGQLAGVTALLTRTDISWIRVRLSCRRATAEARLRSRGVNCDVEARLRAYDETDEDLRLSPANVWDVLLDTDELLPADAAREIALVILSAMT